MRHLIVEACIARGLLDKSAYFWLVGNGTVANLQIPSSPSQPSPWSAFMEGAPLTSSLRSALMLQPAGRYCQPLHLRHPFVHQCALTLVADMLLSANILAQNE